MELNLGTDPESVLVSKSTGRVRSPHGVIFDPDKLNAIGVDGQRSTASIEFRPGISTSAETLVNRLADLIGELRRHYLPKSVIYRAGAYVHPEPLGGHIHFSWPVEKLVSADQVIHVLNGARIMTNFLNEKFFNPEELKQRAKYVAGHGSDFGKPTGFRSGERTDVDRDTMAAVLRTRHIEYRYPPSWLLTPEMAYCYLGGAEIIADRVMNNPDKKEFRWNDYINRLFVTGDIKPPRGPKLSEAYNVAGRFTEWNQDYTANWSGD